MAEYLLSVHNGEDDVYGTEEEMQAAFAAVDAFNQRLEAEDHWVFGGGLQPASYATTVDNSGSAAVVTDGPYLETKEHLGGFWVIKANDLDAALALAKDASKACQGVVEVRPFQGE